MNIFYVPGKLFPDRFKCFFRINMRYKMNTGQHIETVEVKYFYVRKPSAKTLFALITFWLNKLSILICFLNSKN